MEKEIIKLINKEIDNLDEEIKEISKEIKEYTDVYKILKPKGKKFKEENILKFAQELDLVDKLSVMVKKSDLIAIESLNEKMLEYKKIDMEFNDKLKKLGLSKQFIYSDEFIGFVHSKSLNVYNELLKMREREAILFKQNEELVLFTCNVAINIYENNLKCKEQLKHQKKGLTYALESIKEHKSFSSWSLRALEEFSENLTYFNQRKLIVFLNKYNEKLQKEKKKSLQETININKDSKSEQEIKFVDKDESKKEINDPFSDVAKNYLNSIKNMNPQMIADLLKQLSLNSNFVTIINYMISYLGEEDKDLHIYLEKCLDDYFESQIEYKDETEKHNDILYYGFNKKKNYILNDIENITEAYYKDVLKAIEKLRRCNLKSSVRKITDLRKVFEIRIHDIRITCRRISENTYIILGIYCKKTDKDMLLINDTTRRTRELDSYIDNFIEVKDNKFLWDKYLEANQVIEDEILSKINLKIK